MERIAHLCEIGGRAGDPHIAAHDGVLRFEVALHLDRDRDMRQRQHEIEQPAFRALALYEWPLNVRELEKIVTTAAVLTGGGRPISLRDLPEPVARAAAAQPGATRRPAGPSPTPAQIEDLLRRYNGNVADVSRELGKHRAAVWRWMKKWGIGVEKFKKSE